MRYERLSSHGLAKILPERLNDHRGHFSEVFKVGWFRENIADVSFLQENESLSRARGTIRGMHFQVAPFAQGKLVRCIAGRIFDVAVDMQATSPTYGQWYGTELSMENGEQLWIPAGYAHGFATLESNCVVSYKVTAEYNAESERGVRWNDAMIGINWPLELNNIVTSDRDKALPKFSDLSNVFTF
jgi:dTDP-4-dehydrorhamnose 3,5-epimerase